jgi:NTE family protein
MFSSVPLRLLLATHLGYDAFEDARLDLAVTATDLVTGAGLLLDSGSVVDAVVASAAVPGLMPPVRRGDRTLVDGAVGHADALGHADAHGVDAIYLLPAGYPCAGSQATSALAVALTALNVLLHRQLVHEVGAYAGRARLHIAPPLCPLAVSPADFAQGDSLIERARVSTDAWLSHPPGHATDDHQDGGVLALHGRHLRHDATEPLPTRP